MPARRIISLVPSQTELLYDLGLNAEVIGITKFCVHPDHWRSSKTIVGGTKRVDLALVDSLEPDLIVANREENTKADVETLMKKYNVYVSDVSTIDDAYEMMLKIGELTGASAHSLVAEIRNSLRSMPQFESRRALYLIWKKPWMCAGAETFISAIMAIAGFQNVIDADRYPALTEAQIRSLDPEVVLLSSEPYPFKDQHVDELKKLLPASKIILVDGEMFSWYGSRMREIAKYLRTLRLNF